MKSKAKKLFVLIITLLLSFSLCMMAACGTTGTGDDDTGDDSTYSDDTDNGDDSGGDSDDEDTATITAIYLSNSQTTYNRNDTLDTSAFTVNASYSDGSITTLDVSVGTFTLSEGDNDTLTLSVAGEITVTFTYNELSDSTVITVLQACVYKFEAEDDNCVWVDGTRTITMNTEVDGIYAAGNLAQNVGAVISFNLWSDDAGTASLILRLATAYGNSALNLMFDVTVNDVDISSTATVPNSDWYTYVDVEVGDIELVYGLNNISFTVNNNNAGKSGNIDYITLETETELDWATDEQIEAGWLTIEDISLYGEGSTATIEPVFSTNELDITYSFDGDAISIEDGVVTVNTLDTTVTVTATTDYHRVTFTVTVYSNPDYGELVIDDMTLWIGESEEISYEFTISDYASDITYTLSEEGIVEIEDGVVTGLAEGEVTVTATTEHHSTTFTVACTVPTYTFEAEDAEYGGTIGNDPYTQTGGTGTVVGNFNGRLGNYITFTIYAEEECTATLTICLASYYSDSISNFFDITINGEAYSTDAYFTGGSWYTYYEITLGEISLVEGENTITFTVNQGSDGNTRAANIDYITLTDFTATLSSTPFDDE